jgi:hypothetical protein
VQKHTDRRICKQWNDGSVFQSNCCNIINTESLHEQSHKREPIQTQVDTYFESLGGKQHEHMGMSIDKHKHGYKGMHMQIGRSERYGSNMNGYFETHGSPKANPCYECYSEF